MPRPHYFKLRQGPRAASGYKRKPEPGLPPLSEGWALTESARRLDEAVEKQSLRLLQQALVTNLKLWAFFEASAKATDSSTPDDLRPQIIDLARFVDKESRRLLRRPDFRGLDGLIDINRDLARGLFEAARNLPAKMGPEKRLLRISV